MLSSFTTEIYLAENRNYKADIYNVIFDNNTIYFTIKNLSDRPVYIPISNIIFCYKDKIVKPDSLLNSNENFILLEKADLRNDDFLILPSKSKDLVELSSGESQDFFYHFNNLESNQIFSKNALKLYYSIYFTKSPYSDTKILKKQNQAINISNLLSNNENLIGTAEIIKLNPRNIHSISLEAPFLVKSNTKKNDFNLNNYIKDSNKSSNLSIISIKVKSNKIDITLKNTSNESLSIPTRQYLYIEDQNGNISFNNESFSNQLFINKSINDYLLKMYRKIEIKIGNEDKEIYLLKPGDEISINYTFEEENNTLQKYFLFLSDYKNKENDSIEVISIFSNYLFIE